MTGKAAFDIDALEQPERPEPFTVRLNGRDYVLRDMQDIDFRELLAGFRARVLGDPEPLLRSALAEEDRAEFFSNQLPPWKLEKLFGAYNKHYGVSEDPGEASASPGS